MSVDGSRSTVGIVLAAGEGRRFGGLKQLAEFRGRPLLEHAAASMTEVFGAATVIVLGNAAERIAEQADLGRASVVECSDWRHGQAASLRRGVEAAGQTVGELDAVVVILGDQPLISAEAIRRVAGARATGAEVARATYGGRPGHPVLLAGKALTAIADLDGDVGARELIERAGFTPVICDDAGSDIDIDTSEALVELERSEGLPPTGVKE